MVIIAVSKLNTTAVSISIVGYVNEITFHLMESISSLVEADTR